MCFICHRRAAQIKANIVLDARKKAFKANDISFASRLTSIFEELTKRNEWKCRRIVKVLFCELRGSFLRTHKKRVSKGTSRMSSEMNSTIPYRWLRRNWNEFDCFSIRKGKYGFMSFLMKVWVLEVEFEWGLSKWTRLVVRWIYEILLMFVLSKDGELYNVERFPSIHVETQLKRSCKRWR
jgi:hypothetical protein